VRMNICMWLADIRLSMNFTCYVHAYLFSSLIALVFVSVIRTVNSFLLSVWHWYGSILHFRIVWSTRTVAPLPDM